MLADDGTAILKFFLHISKKEQSRAVPRHRSRSAGSLAGDATPTGTRHKKYDEYLAAIEEMLELTESEFAPWTIVEATSKWYARKKIFDTIVAAWRSGWAPPRRHRRSKSRRRRPRTPNCARPWKSLGGGKALMLETLDLTRTLAREDYVREVTRRQIQLRELGYQVYLQKRPVIILFEGWDAAGKGGAIKRITEKLDPRGYVVYPISAPQGEDKTRHYLYRFWRRLPERGQIAIFDRSWYGRVLVERVEGFAREEEWKRALQGDQLLRAPIARFRNHPGEVLDSHLPRGAAPPLRGAQDHRLQSLEAHRRGLAQPREVGRLRGSRRGDAGEDQHERRRPGAWWKATTNTGHGPRCWRSWWRCCPPGSDTSRQTLCAALSGNRP